MYSSIFCQFMTFKSMSLMFAWSFSFIIFCAFCSNDDFYWISSSSCSIDDVKRDLFVCLMLYWIFQRWYFFIFLFNWTSMIDLKNSIFFQTLICSTILMWCLKSCIWFNVIFISSKKFVAFSKFNKRFDIRLIIHCM